MTAYLLINYVLPVVHESKNVFKKLLSTLLEANVRPNLSWKARNKGLYIWVFPIKKGSSRKQRKFLENVSF